MQPRRVVVSLGVLALALCAAFSSIEAQEQTVGLFLNEDGSYDGYTLFAPILSGAAYLIDNDGMLVHSWDFGNTGPTPFPYLLDDGSVIRAASIGLGAPTSGGVQKFAWDGSLVWDFEYAGVHHDIEVLPNGNVLMIAYEDKTSEEAIGAGRDPALLSAGELWPGHVVEVEPIGATGGNIVWEWHSWDHLIQDYNPSENNYGVVADHPELIDINFGQLSARDPADWLHTNAIDYNPEFDQIVLSVPHFNELWVIDHSTTTAEGAGHSGGKSGRGGDILYRWGNPQAYGAGDEGDQKLFFQHDVRWIEPGLPGEGDILVFNNGRGRPEGSYSSVDEIVPPVDTSGNYFVTPGQAYGPEEQIWIYAAANPADFYAPFISGAHRLPTGNTLINDGVQGTFFEVTAEGATVWKYVNPVTSDGPLAQGVPITDNENLVFRAHRYASDFLGLQGRDLTPAGPLELDTDGDLLSDLAEVNVHGTDSLLADTDGDGCGDGAELGPTASQGGGRDPLDIWDVYDTDTENGLNAGAALGGNVTIGDIFAVAGRFGSTGDPTIDPLSDASGPGYHTRLDRGGQIGSNVWNQAPANGAITISDIVAVTAQFGLNC